MKTAFYALSGLSFVGALALAMVGVIDRQALSMVGALAFWVVSLVSMFCGDISRG